MLFARVVFSVAGRPKGKGRPKVGPGGLYPSKETEAEEALIRQLGRKAFGGQPPILGPVRLSFEAVFAMPASWPSRVQGMTNLPHVSKPDIDNIEKLLLDALNGVAWRDDAQICEVVKRKRYGEGERLDVVIEQIPTSVDHPAVRRAEARALEDTITPRTTRKKRRRPVAPAIKEQPIGKRLK